MSAGLPWERGRVYVLAEAGVNHNGSLERALLLVDAAAEAGADAVKFQAFKAEEVVQPNAEKAQYQKESTGTDEDQLEMIRKLELPADAFGRLADRAAERGIEFVCTPFDAGSADLLGTLASPVIKVPSGEITNHPLLRRIAAQRKPLIVSTGMASLGEIEEALAVIRESGIQDIALMHCTSSYPAPVAEVNLRVIETLRTAFQLPVGYSDHTLGIEIPVAAVACGAAIVEKHFTLDKSLPGPDQAMSLDPGELRSMVSAIRRVEQALGSPVKTVTPCEEDVKRVARRSICAARDIAVGEALDETMVSCKRPGTGIAPNQLPLVLGRRVARSVKAGEMLTWSDI